MINFFTLYLDTGFYTWNVQCLDIRNNAAYALNNWSVNITNPDLEILSSNIIFSNNSPKEGQQIQINATIKNKGNVNATTPFKVQFFNGDPDFGGVQIGINQTINSLGTGKNVTLNVSWIISSPGRHDIYVIVDPPLISNGVIVETNENNNKAYLTLNVPAWTILYGNISARIELATQSNDAVSNWHLNSPSGNIYAVETGSSVTWNSLQALGLKTDNTSASNDFNELDLELGMTNFIDNLTSLYTINNQPKKVENFTVYNKNILNVPVINSTVNNNFIMGVFWDTADGGLEYDGTQDIIFVTKINQDQIGKYGTYDYEMNVPALFRNYHEVTYNTIDYYTEIK
jgi:hypothetical protein